MGIVNLTPDSFYHSYNHINDKDKYNNNIESLNLNNQINNSTFDIIDIGAESTRPNALEISFEE